MIRIGTSGFSYQDWKGVFYPQRISSQGMLEFYIQHFDALELNFTYYRLPTPGQLGNFVNRSRGKLELSVKAHQSFTHQRTEDVFSQAKQFRQCVDEIQNSHVLGALLFQFPYAFKNNQSNRRYLSRLKDTFPDYPLVFEFRHISWMNQAVFDFLMQMECAFCCVDEPPLPDLLPPKVVVTSPLGYVRLHGRNAEKWWKHSHAWERYHYRYSREELTPWVEKIKGLTEKCEKVLVFANNHYQGNAADNAMMLRDMLGKKMDSSLKLQQLSFDFSDLA